MITEIKNFIEHNIPELKGKLYPVFTTDIKNLSVKYAVTPLSGGHLKQSQLELSVIDSDYDRCQETEALLTSLLDMEGDAAFNVHEGIAFHSSLSGGGVLFNDGCQKYEDTVYFIIDWREI